SIRSPWSCSQLSECSSEVPTVTSIALGMAIGSPGSAGRIGPQRQLGVAAEPEPAAEDQLAEAAGALGWERRVAEPVEQGAARSRARRHLGRAAQQRLEQPAVTA